MEYRENAHGGRSKMATRRARIKAIVNVPARRAKLNEESVNSKVTKTSDSTNGDNLPTSPPEKSIVSPDNDGGTTVCSTRPSLNEHNSSLVSEGGSESRLGIGKSAEDILNSHSDALVDTPVAVDEGCQHIADVTSKVSKDVSDDINIVSKSGSEESTSESLIDKINVNNRKNKEVAPLNSPVKKRPRLFIRPSPKLVDTSARRFPSGTRHKASSESEEETRTRSSAIEDTELQVAETSNRSANSLQEKTTKPQETITTNSSEPAGDLRKNGSRSGRQRAKNKENRVSDARRRLWHQMRKGNKTTPVDRMRLTMFDYIYYNPVTNPMRSSSESSVTNKSQEESIVDSDLSNALSEERVDDPGEGGSLLEENHGDGREKIVDDNETGAEAEDSGMPAPRVKVGPDGELILDEQSLVIETTGLKEGLQDLAKGPALVESSSFTNYSTFSKRTKGHEWSENETLRFYRALNVCGTDFSLMQNLLFENRSRRDLKNKFKREERRNSSLIEKALRYPGVFSNIEELQTEFAKSAEPAVKSKAGQKRGRGRGGRSCGGKQTVKKDGPPPAKKRKKRNWIVSGNVSEREDSDCEDNDTVVSDRRKELAFDAPINKTVESTRLSPSDVIYNVSDEDVMMASQEIVITNDDFTSGSLAKDGTGQKGHRENESSVEDDSDGGESVSSESLFLSRVLQPTRSGRIPKRREVNKVYESSHKKAVEELEIPKQATRQITVKVSQPKDQSLRQDKKTDVILYSKEAEEGSHVEISRDPLAIELTQCSSAPSLSANHVNGMEPGSLVVIATTAPDNPSHQVYQVFMVSPKVDGQEPVLIPQNLESEYKIETVKQDEEQSEPASILPVNNVSGEYSDVRTAGFSEGLASCSVGSDETKIA